MAALMRLAALVAAVAVVAAVDVAWSTRSDDAPSFSRSTSCAQSCDVVNSNFDYPEGTVHEFDYTASAQFTGGDESPFLGVSARAQVTGAGGCEMILKMSHVKFVDAAGLEQAVPEAFSAGLLKNPLRFGFVRGAVAAVCPAGDEPRWALNFKRAVLSNFQNSMTNFKSSQAEWLEEDDVSGVCSSSYTSRQVEKDTYAVTRRRDASCVPPAPPATNNLKSKLAQMLPLVYKKQTCQQTITNRALNESVCEEFIRLPWNSDDEAPVVHVKTSLKNVHNYQVDFVVMPNYEAARLGLALQWEDPTDDLPPPEWLSLATDLVEQLTDVAPVPALYNQLTELLKLFNYDQIVQLFTTLRPQTWTTAAAAVEQLGTEASFKILKQFISDGYGWSTFDGPAGMLIDHMKKFELSPEMLELISENLYDLRDHGDGVSSALVKINNYCRHHSNCLEDASVRKVLEKLETSKTPIECMREEEFSKENNSSTTVDYKDYMTEQIYKLEYFNKLGIWNKTMQPQVEKCLYSGYKLAEYAALEALRNAPCDWFNYETLMESFNKQNLYEDNTLAVMFYTTLMRCQPENFAEKLKEKLANKDVTQLTSFMWSHLSNTKDDTIARTVLNDPTLKLKFAPQNLRFSRNYKKDVVCMNRTFNVDMNLVFSEQSLRPEFFSLNVVTDNGSVDFLKIVSRTKNFSTTEVVAVCSVEVMGKLMYGEEKTLTYDHSHFEMYNVLLPAVEHVMENVGGLVGEFSFNTLAKWLGFDLADVEYEKHFMLTHYPTSLGMPFNIRVNKTIGSLTQAGNIPPFYAKQMDMSMLLDATYANIGTSMKASCRMNPKHNVTFSNPIQVVMSLPQERTEFMEFNIGKYNIKNNILTPRYPSKQQPEKSVCIPGIKNITGSTACFVYTPNDDWFPKSVSQYKIVVDRNNDFQGHNLTFYFDDAYNEISCEKIGNPSQRYSFRWSHLAQIFNMKLQCPHFTVEGSGILSFEEEAMNITGLLTCSKDVAPFTLTGSKTFYDEATEASRYEVNFNSSIFKSSMVSECTMGANKTAEVVKTYWSKYHPVDEKVVMSMKCLKIDVAPNVTRHEVEAHMNCTKYPKTKFDMEAHCEHDEVADSYDFDGYCKGSCTDNTTITYTCEGKCYETETRIVSFFNYSHPEMNVTFNEGLHMLTLADNTTSNRVFSVGLCNNKTAYELEANCGINAEGDYYFNKTFFIPYKEDQTKMWYYSKTKALCNMPLRKAEFECVKRLGEDSMSLNASAAAVTDAAGTPLFALGRDYGYRAAMEAKCSNYGPLTMQAQSKMSADHQNMEMDVSVKTPFIAWNKPELLLKMKKAGQKMKASATSKNDRKKPETYSIEGISDYDIFTNLIV